MDVPLKKPAKLQILQLSYKKRDELKYVYENKNCQATVCNKKQKKCEYDDSKSHSSKCFDKECQEYINTNDVWLLKPAIRRLCSDKNCQSCDTKI